MPVTSPYPPIDIPQIGLYDLLYAELAPEDEDRIAVIDTAEGTETTYLQLRTFVNSTAGGLSSRGVKMGDVVGLHCPNSAAFVIACHALWRLGAIVTPISLLSSPEAIGSQLRESGATMLLTVAALGDAGAAGATAAGLDEDAVIHLDLQTGLQQMLAERISPPEVHFDPQTQVAALPFSSGTTGLPKGVQLTHANLVANILQSRDQELLRREDIVFGVLPFFHIYGLTALANLAICQRATLVTQPRFEVEAFLRAHEKYGVTFTFIAPPIAVLLAKHPVVEQYNLSSLRAVLSGAATLDGELAQAVEKRLGIHVQQGYGMTETSPVTHLNLDPDSPRGCIGRAVTLTEHKLVSPETGEEVPVPDDLPDTPAGLDGDAAPAPVEAGDLLSGDAPGYSAVGELWVRGPQIMLGYLNRPEETAATLPGDGWLRTGDLAVQDSQGRVFIVDRLKELIKYKGYQVPPAELEALLLTHPHVADAAVVGVLRDGEEIPKAHVVPQAGADLSEAQVMDFVAERVPSYKKVREVEFIAQVPKSATGKILRRELRASDRAAD